jgi:regulator of protease activity HflC (stomatin/prohibitin superfamily)
MYVLFIIIGVIIILVSLRVIKEYERGVKFTLGKFSSIMTPGLNLVVPIFQTCEKVDIRTKAVDVPDQDCMTKDNISVNVNAVIYYKISDAKKSIIEVEDYMYATSQLAQTTMRNIVGEVELDELLSNRDDISLKIKDIIDKATDPWGIKVDAVELKDVILPGDLKRTMSKQAEAEREKRAVIIKAEGEKIAAQNIADGAKILASSPGALHLRTLHAINDISSDQSNTIVFAIPIEVLRAFESVSKLVTEKKSK